MEVIAFWNPTVEQLYFESKEGKKLIYLKFYNNKENGSADNLCEELGDLLLQVVMLTRIAEEEGAFDLTDVIEGVSRKMIRRHPYVFGENPQQLKEEIPGQWEEIKRLEKGQKTDGEVRREKEAVRAAEQQIIHHLSGRYSRKTLTNSGFQYINSIGLVSVERQMP